jgi:hypothetical protein
MAQIEARAGAISSFPFRMRPDWRWLLFGCLFPAFFEGIPLMVNHSLGTIPWERKVSFTLIAVNKLVMKYLGEWFCSVVLRNMRFLFRCPKKYAVFVPLS